MAAKQTKCLVQSSHHLAQSKAKAQQQQAQSEGAPSSGNIHDKRMYSHWPYCGGFPGGASGKGLTCQCRRCKRLGCDPWVGKIPWRRAWQPTPVLLPGESHRQRSLAGCSAGAAESQTRLSDQAPRALHSRTSSFTFHIR